MLAIVPRMPTAAATGFTTFRAPVFAMGADYSAVFAPEGVRSMR